MLKKVLYIISILFVVAVLGYKLADEPLPIGQAGPQAEYLTDKILSALHYEAWKQMGAVAWSYPLGHYYLWDKKANLVCVKWDEYTVLLNPDDRSGKVYIDGKEQTEGKGELLAKAFKYFANDSFWLIAPFKLRDPGTVRKVVRYEGQEALLVQYQTGGVTPGDAYLWLVDEHGVPYAWKFWVQIVPIGGIKYTWEHWVSLNGVQIATFHEGIFDIAITGLRSADSPAKLNEGIDPFSSIR